MNSLTNPVDLYVFFVIMMPLSSFCVVGGVLDSLDNSILAALSADSSTSTALLARRFGVARSTVQARIERLKRNGTIARFTVKLGDVALARRIKATVLLRIEARSTANVVQHIKKLPEVEMVHSTSGRFDLIL